ncbi:MAG: cytochrome c [Candidatus Dadabacteria bacterium]|jgi:cytochrome c2
MKTYLAIMLILLFSISSKASEENPSLKFLKSGELVKELSLSELKDKLTIHKIKFLDLMHQKQKSYKAFTLQDVVKLGFEEGLNNPEFTDVAYQALDGYVSVSSISKLKEPGGYIVYEDLDFENWEPISIKQVTPGPFYLVWTGKDQTTQNEYPWPWQLSSIDLIKFEDQYPAVFPKGVSTDSTAYKGYEIFKGRCVRCHSMNQQGGKIGPDLNAPQSIVTYRSENMIKEFIKHPSKYRYSQMPDHPDLSDQYLNNIISYFYYMNENRN